MTKSSVAAKPAVGLPAIIASITILVLFAAGLAWHFFGSSGGGAPPRALTAQEQSDRDFVNQKAKESSGVFNQLSQEDQRRLISIEGPGAPFKFLQEAKRLKSNP